MTSIFELPDDLLASLITSFPCREAQINALATLIHPRIAPCRNLVVHGTEATGKSSIVSDLLQTLRDASSSDLNYAIVKSAECVTARHFFERTVGLVGDALRNESAPARCETLAALTAELTKTLKYTEQDPRSRFVLVFDGIDRQRDAPPTLLPALARLSEIIPNLTTIFIITTPSPSLMRICSPPHIHFPPYTKAQYIAILSRTPPASLPNTTQQETTELWTRFTAAVHDSLARPAARTLPRLRQCCATLWPRFTAPVASGTHKAREFSKLLIAARAYFQDESILEPGIQRARRDAPLAEKKKSSSGSGTDLSTLLPPTARHLLIAAYLASHNAPRHDNALFSTWHAGGKKRRRGGVAGSSTPNGTGRGRRAKHRRIARKLLGPGVFVLERMVAIYVATRQEWIPGAEDGKGGVDGDVGMAIATLASLRLLVRVGGGAAGAAAGAGGGADLDRGGKWRVNVGWEIIRSVGRSMGVEVEEWLVE
ncbi:origin recognition complex subunit 5 C-terminus-domain-containing protein [Xylaria bambusicola]|uniref:origin recognition complex subunit 5 C-terminus-domain-containing protein n=1 Tax=Xylaria bambusicola TaxID=326684 RepID=UPI0020089121|nr:origin recognition complex subunit 5 C-terminus-domain-containing protein [Xylaria bambusicola]KAI0518541.1 origin recognition complex subunit 5 C-terminus-domain-containing protein [Xylaria bambusicola]